MFFDPIHGRRKELVIWSIKYACVPARPILSKV
jgi:hypothetical protein